MGVVNHSLFSNYKMAFIRYFKRDRERDSASTFLPDPKGPLSTSLSTGTIKLPTKLFCVMGVVKRHTFLFKIINFENLF